MVLLRQQTTLFFSKGEGILGTVWGITGKAIWIDDLERGKE